MSFESLISTSPPVTGSFSHLSPFCCARSVGFEPFGGCKRSINAFFSSLSDLSLSVFVGWGGESAESFELPWVYSFPWGCPTTPGTLELLPLGAVAATIGSLPIFPAGGTAGVGGRDLSSIGFVSVGMSLSLALIVSSYVFVVLVLFLVVWVVVQVVVVKVWRLNTAR